MAFRADLCDDFPDAAAALSVSSDAEACLDYCLSLIEGLLAVFGKCLANFSLPSCQFIWGLCA